MCVCVGGGVKLQTVGLDFNQRRGAVCRQAGIPCRDGTDLAPEGADALDAEHVVPESQQALAWVCVVGVW